MKKPIILSLDGYKTAHDFLTALDLLLKNKYLTKMVSFVKINDAVHNLDFGGPSLVSEILFRIKPYNIGLMLDFKLPDVGETDKNILEHYREILERYPDVQLMVTIRESASAKTFMILRQKFPFLKIIVVSTLTDMTEEECQRRYGMKPDIKVLNDSRNIKVAYDWEITKAKSESKDEFNYPQYPFDLLVCSPKELAFLQINMWPNCGYICPGIRDSWMLKGGMGTQKRVMGIKEALDLVVDDNEVYFVMATQLIKGNKDAGITSETSIEMTYNRMIQSTAIKIENNHYQTLVNSDGLYESPKNEKGVYIGPIVAYAGKDLNGNNYVGFSYFNVAKVEQDPKTRKYFAKLLANKIKEKFGIPDHLAAAPMGGIIFSVTTGDSLGCNVSFFEKKVTKLADPANRTKEESELIYNRHDIKTDDKVIIFEDLVNNFSTTQKMVDLLASKGTEVIAIACIINRSNVTSFADIPIISVIHIPTPEYKQTDEEVRALIEAGNIVLKPKAEWDILKKAMK